MKELNNMIFPSKEGDGIEHVDMEYEDFMKYLEDAFNDVHDEAFEEGKSEGYEEGFEEGRHD